MGQTGRISAPWEPCLGTKWNTFISFKIKGLTQGCPSRGSPGCVMAASAHVCKICVYYNNNLASYVYHLLWFLYVRSANQPTVIFVALCQKTLDAPGLIYASILEMLIECIYIFSISLHIVSYCKLFSTSIYVGLLWTNPKEIDKLEVLGLNGRVM